MSSRRPAGFVVLALALVAAHGIVAALRAPVGDGPAREGAPQSARPSAFAEPISEIATLLLGGFRAVAADALWLRLLDRYEAGDYGEVLPLAEALLGLDPRFERAYLVAAWTLAVDIPSLEPEAEAWPYVRQGLLLLRKGTARNPRSWLLRAHEAYLSQRLSKLPPLAERFANDPKLDAERIGALAQASRLYREAQRIDGHAVYVDWGLVETSIALGRLDEAAAALRHVRAAHPEASPEQIASFEEAIARPLRAPP